MDVDWLPVFRHHGIAGRVAQGAVFVPMDLGD